MTRVGRYIPIGRGTRSPTIEAMRAETRPGRCICCDEPLLPREPGVKSPKKRMCGAALCLRLYQRLWKADQRAAERERVYLVEFGRFARGEIP